MKPIKPKDFERAAAAAFQDWLDRRKAAGGVVPDPTEEELIQATMAHLPRPLTAEGEKGFRMMLAIAHAAKAAARAHSPAFPEVITDN